MRRSALAAAVVVLLAATAGAEPRTIRVQKGLPGIWPGVGLVPAEAEAVGFLRLAPLRTWMDAQGGSKSFDELLDDLGGDVVRDTGIASEEIRLHTRSIVFAVAGKASQPLGSGLAGLLIFGGTFDDHALESRLSGALTVVSRVGERRIFARHDAGKDGEGICVVPGGLLYGSIPWVETALRRAQDPNQRSEGGTQRLARTRIPPGQSAFAWFTIVPSAATRNQLAPIKPFIGSLDGLVAAAARGDRDARARLSLRLGFHTPAQATEASAFLQQILSLAYLSGQGRGGLQGLLGGVMSGLSGALRVDGSDVVAEIVR